MLEVLLESQDAVQTGSVVVSPELQPLGHVWVGDRGVGAVVSFLPSARLRICLGCSSRHTPGLGPDRGRWT